MGINMSAKASNKEKGVLALFSSPENLVLAIKKVRTSLSIKSMEAFTPFPVHGLEHAMGLKRSWIPYFTLCMALIGATLGFGFQYWTHAVSWPLNIGGKPFFSWPAYVPIAFECMILIGGVSTVIILYVVCGLPRYDKPVLDPRLTADCFGLFIDNSDKNFDEKRLNEIFKEVHALEVKQIG